MKRITIIVAILLVSYTQSFPAVPAVEDPVKGLTVKVMQRVDRTDPTTEAVLRAWVDSLSVWTNPDNHVQESSDSHRKTSANTRHVIEDWFSQSDGLSKSYPPTILSIERTNLSWMVRTAFALQQAHNAHVIPLGIVRCWFSLDAKGRLVVDHPFEHTTAELQSTHVGSITYKHGPHTTVDVNRAQAAEAFIDGLVRNFSLASAPETEIYLTNNRDEMCALLGIEYFAFPPEGFSFTADNTILQANSEEFYAHELVHVVLGNLANGAHPIIHEGIATWLGGSGSQDFTQLASDYLERTPKEQIPSFVKLFTEPPTRQDDRYVLGAVLCNAVHQRGGVDGVKKLLLARSTSETMLVIGRELGIEPADVQPSLFALIQEAITPAKVKPGR